MYIDSARLQTLSNANAVQKQIVTVKVMQFGISATSIER